MKTTIALLLALVSGGCTTNALPGSTGAAPYASVEECDLTLTDPIVGDWDAACAPSGERRAAARFTWKGDACVFSISDYFDPSQPIVECPSAKLAAWHGSSSMTAISGGVAIGFDLSDDFDQAIRFAGRLSVIARLGD